MINLTRTTEHNKNTTKTQAQSPHTIILSLHLVLPNYPFQPVKIGFKLPINLWAMSDVKLLVLGWGFQ